MKTFKDLERCFYNAIVNNKKYLACFIELKPTLIPEIVINERINFSEKIVYLRDLYNDDLTHKHLDGVKIIDFIASDNFEEIELRLQR